jgi:LysR family transcriptional regulator, hca operon transcriptional activator
MELRHLRYFVAVAEELNFTKAAQRLFTAQPSLSQQIKDLENEIGVQLLERTNRKVELTEAGQAFLKQALLSLEAAEQAIQDAKRVVNIQQKQLSIGFVPVAEMKVFPYIMPNIRAHFPDLNIHFQSLTDRQQLEALRQGDLDIAFTRYVHADEGIESIKIFDEPLNLIIPKDAPEANLKHISIQQFSHQKFIVSEQDASPELKQVIQQFFAQNKLDLNVVQESSNILLNVNLVGMGVGWSLVPAYVIPLLGDKIAVKNTVEPLPMISLYVSYRSGKQKPSIELIMKVLKEQFYMDFMSS